MSDKRTESRSEARLIAERVNVHEAKTHLSRILERVERGDEFVVCRAGRPIARLSRWEDDEPVQPRPLGKYKDQITINPSFYDDDWLPEEFQRKVGMIP